jgi:Fe2+ transport system protein FeoA
MTAKLGDPNSFGADEVGGRRHRYRWGRRDPAGGCGRGQGRGKGRGGGCHGRLQSGSVAETGEGSLCGVPVGSTVTVTGIRGDESFRGRVLAMGIMPGVSVTVMSGGAKQPQLIALPGSRCVLDWRSSTMIAVRERRPETDHERKAQ